MTHLSIHNPERKISPIYKKINPEKWMDLIKPLGEICNTFFTSQILTNPADNTWTFHYRAYPAFLICISFNDKSTDLYSYIKIHHFAIPMVSQNKRLDDKILQLIVHHVQSLNFEELIFVLRYSNHMDLCKRHGFHQIGINEMTLSLKAKFFPVSGDINRYKTNF